MPNQINTILRKLKYNNQKLNILTELYDESRISDLSQTGHNFFVLPKNLKDSWNHNIRPKPNNVNLFKDFEECFFSLTEYAYDLYLSSNSKENFISSHLGIPVLIDSKEICINTDLFKPDIEKENIAIYISQKRKIDIDILENIHSKIDFVFINNSNKLEFKSLLHTYKRSSFYINLSESEKISKSMLEAMACGCCPIAYKNETNETIIKNGENGFLYENINDVVQIVQKLISIKDLTKNICNNSRETILNKFSFDNFIKNWNDKFSETSKSDWWKTNES